jgi:hypothetical protein
MLLIISKYELRNNSIATNVASNATKLQRKCKKE